MMGLEGTLLMGRFPLVLLSNTPDFALFDNLSCALSCCHPSPASSSIRLFISLLLPLQIARAKTIAKHFVDRQNQEASSAKEAAEKAAAGTIISLGLVEDPTAGKDKGNGKEKEKH